MAGPPVINPRHLYHPPTIESSTIDLMVVGDIRTPHVPNVSVRAMGGIRAVPKTRVGFPAWSEHPPPKPSWPIRGVGNTAYHPAAYPLTSCPHQQLTSHPPRLPPLHISAMSPADITTSPPCHPPRHPLYPLHDKFKSCWCHPTKMRQSLPKSNFLLKKPQSIIFTHIVFVSSTRPLHALLLLRQHFNSTVHHPVNLLHSSTPQLDPPPTNFSFHY